MAADLTVVESGWRMRSAVEDRSVPAEADGKAYANKSAERTLEVVNDTMFRSRCSVLICEQVLILFALASRSTLPPTPSE
jgi:hypothetical protein